MPSFETCLILMFDMIGLRRETPEFWDARHESLRTGWKAPDNWHWTNFPMAPRYRRMLRTSGHGTQWMKRRASYRLADAATSNDGPLTWNVTINQKEQPTCKLQNTATSSAPHTNSLTFNTTPDTKPAPLNLTLDAIYLFCARSRYRPEHRIGRTRPQYSQVALHRP
jgi:hypothetical protein